MNYELNILHLYPDLLNLYGDKGNISCLEKRLVWRNMGANISKCTAKDNVIDFDNTDIILLGGGNDRELEIVLSYLLEKKDALSAFVENGGTLLALCGGYELLGKYHQTPDKKVECLGILDIYTETKKGKNRLIGDVIIHNEEIGNIVGFENHGGRIQIGDYAPLGKVKSGFGNNEISGYEGVTYKNLIGTYLHGPLLPKNPKLCDLILSRALKRKYPDFSALAPLDDALENKANEYIVSTFCDKVSK